MDAAKRKTATDRCIETPRLQLQLGGIIDINQQQQQQGHDDKEEEEDAYELLTFSVSVVPSRRV